MPDPVERGSLQSSSLRPVRLEWLPRLAFLGGGVVLALALVLLVTVTHGGWKVVGLDFIMRPTSGVAESAGIWPALAGTAWLTVVTLAVAFPVGVGAAIYFDEYAPPARLTTLIQSTMTTLAGVPSVIYGILGLAVFVEGLGLGRSVLAGGLTLAALALPTVFLTTQEALRAVPNQVREAAYGLGATQWQVIRSQVLPAAAPGIITGSVLAFTRTVGETAPLIVIGALSFVSFAPSSLSDPFTALPNQIYAWGARPDGAFADLAAGAIIVLLAILLAMNLLAFALRQRYGRS